MNECWSQLAVSFYWQYKPYHYYLLLSVAISINTVVVRKIHCDSYYNGCFFPLQCSPLPRLRMCFGIRLFNLELFVLVALNRHPTYLFLVRINWSSMCGILQHRHHKGLGGCNFGMWCDILSMAPVQIVW